MRWSPVLLGTLALAFGGCGESGGSTACEPGYEPCVSAHPPDVDCLDVGEPVTVTGDDPHGLDRDGDGAGCEAW